MKLSESYFLTKKEDVKDEESISGNLLVRAGMIKKIGSGLFIFLPLGLKVMRKIEKIVRDEMDGIFSQELVIPSILPVEYYNDSGRKDVFAEDIFSLKDRSGRDYILSPTHEEIFLDVCRDVIKSYKDLPISLYQMANKYRDELRSRYGLIRTREFVVKDAYTFDKDKEGLDKSYKLMFEAYKRIFDRIGINYKIVKAASGVMGGMFSEEFQAIIDIGEDRIVICDKCGLATNVEVCPCSSDVLIDSSSEKEKELLYTPNCGTINDLLEKYNILPVNTCKTMIYKVDDKFYAFMVRGNRDVNEYKIKEAFNTENVVMATFEEDEAVTGAAVGFAGPIGLDIPVIIDNEVLGMKNFLVGANKTNYHYVNTNIRDFKYERVLDIRNVSEEDICPNCSGKLTFKNGIEIGKILKLGTKYSEAMNLTFTDEDNKLQPVFMVSYGIGIARVLAAVVEQNHDEFGIVFPECIAPYEVAIVVVNKKDEVQMKLAEEIYYELQSRGLDVILDDRDLRAGVKFKDMDLIGVPKRITVGRRAEEGIVEYKDRCDSEAHEVKIKDLVI